MRELSHQISVCAAAWPGGQQDRREKPLAADTLWTRGEVRRRGRGRRRGGGGVWREMEMGKAAVYCLPPSIQSLEGLMEEDEGVNGGEGVRGKQQRMRKNNKIREEGEKMIPE